MGSSSGIYKAIKSVKNPAPASLPSTTSLYVDVSVLMHSIHSSNIELALDVAQITPSCATLGTLVTRYAAAIATYSAYTRTTDNVTYVFEGIASKAVTDKRQRSSAIKKNEAFRNALLAPKSITRRKAAERKLAYCLGRAPIWFVNFNRRDEEE